MPKIGMSSTAIILEPWINALKIAAENGFEAFEVSCVYPSVDTDNPTQNVIAEARKVIEKSGIEICVHAPFYELNIAAYSRGIREESVRLIKNSIDLCEKLGGKTLIAHTGTYTYKTPPGGSDAYHTGTKIQQDYNIESLKKINNYANSKGITVCLENIGLEPNSIDQSFEDLIEIRKSVGSTLQFTLDLGHARLTEGAEKGILLLGDNIRHIHLTDNHGEKDDHLTVGDGNYDYSGFIDFLINFPYVITLEVVEVSTDPGPVLRGRNALNNLLKR